MHTITVHCNVKRTSSSSVWNKARRLSNIPKPLNMVRLMKCFKCYKPYHRSPSSSLWRIFSVCWWFVYLKNSKRHQIIPDVIQQQNISYDGYKFNFPQASEDKNVNHYSIPLSGKGGRRMGYNYPNLQTKTTIQKKLKMIEQANKARKKQMKTRQSEKSTNHLKENRSSQGRWVFFFF